MKKLIFAVAFSAALAGCATADFQPYEGINSTAEGQGGTKLVVDGVDFWANGNPPRKYQVLGVVSSQVGGGRLAEDRIRSVVAEKVKEVGGNAAIQLSSDSSYSGTLHAAPGVFAAARQRVMRFTVVKYLPQ